MEKSKGKGIFYGWWIVLASLVLTTLTTPFTSSLVSLYLIPVTEDFGIPRSAFTMTTSIVAICSIALSPFVGRVVQKYNTKMILAVSLTVFALSFMSYGLAQSAFHLYLSATVLGIAFAFCGNLTTQIIIVNWFKKSRGLAMSLVVSGIGLGGFIFSPIIANLIMTMGWRQAYYIMGLVILVVGLPIILLIFKNRPEDIGLTVYGEGEKIIASKNIKALTAVDIDVAEAKKSAFFYIYMVGIFALGLTTTGSLQQINPYISDMHGLAFGAAIVSLYSLLGILGKLFLGWISDKIGVFKAGSIGYVALTIAFVLLLFGQNKTMLIIMAVIFALGNAVASVSISLFTTSVFGFKNSAVMLGLTNSAMQIGMALGGIMTGGIYDITGSYFGAWISLICISLLSVTCIMWSYSNSKKHYAEATLTTREVSND